MKDYLNFSIGFIPVIYSDTREGINKVVTYAIARDMEQGKQTFNEILSDYGLKMSEADFNKFKSEIIKLKLSSLSTGSKTNILFQCLSYGDKDKLAYCMYLAIRSIVGKKEYSLITRNLILSRMSGIPGSNCQSFSKEDFSEYIQTLYGNNGRRRFERLLCYVQEKYLLSTYSPPGAKGIYVSVKLTEKELIFQVEKMIARKRTRMSKREKIACVNEIRALLRLNK